MISNLSRRAAQAALAVAILVLPASGSLAFDALRDALSRFARPETAGGAIFDFLAPSAVRDWSPRDNPGIGWNEVNYALVGPGPALALTGIDFPALSAILVFGDPPADAIFLAGPGLDGRDIGKALLARNFTVSKEAGATVYSLGEDGRVDMRAINRNDPFGKSMGMAQRVAVGPHGLIESRAWAPLRSRLPLATEEAPLPPAEQATAKLFADMIAAAAAERPGGEAYAASGFEARAFGDTPPQSFLHAFIVASQAPDGEAAQIVLTYPDLAAAEAGSSEVSSRLQAFERWSPPAGTRYQTAVTASTGGPMAITVISAIFPAGEGHPSAAALRAWRNAIYRRQFTVLGP